MPSCKYQLNGQVYDVVDGKVPCQEGRTWTFVPGFKLPTADNQVGALNPKP